MDRRDPGALGLAREAAAPEVDEPPPHTALELGGGLLGEGDREHPLDRHAVLEHRFREPLDEHAGLTASRPRVQEQRTVAALHDTLSR